MKVRQRRLGQEAKDFNWLINALYRTGGGGYPRGRLSSDGMPVVVSDHLPRDKRDQPAAVTPSLVSVTNGAAMIFDGDEIRQTVVEMGRGYFLVMSIRDGSIPATLAAREADVGVVGYEMAMLAKQAGEVLSPAIREELPGTAAAGYDRSRPAPTSPRGARVHDRSVRRSPHQEDERAW